MSTIHCIYFRKSKLAVTNHYYSFYMHTLNTLSYLCAFIQVTNNEAVVEDTWTIDILGYQTSSA